MHNLIHAIEITADVASIQGIEEPLIKALAGCHDPAPLVNGGFARKERILRHIESSLCSRQTHIKEFKRVNVNGKLIFELTEYATSAVHLGLGFGYTAFQRLHALRQCLAEVALLLFLGQYVV